jgi:hypothetical protein
MIGNGLTCGLGGRCLRLGSDPNVLVRALASAAAFGCLTWAPVLYGRTATPAGACRQKEYDLGEAWQLTPAVPISSSRWVSTSGKGDLR